MTDATILIPTFRHAALLPYAIRSALTQADASVEVFVVGDGVEDDTRAALEPFLGDERVHFFDNPKGERHGERHRHAALQHARGRIVCYLSDDDLLLPDHIAEQCRLLEDADFAHSAPFYIAADGTLSYSPIDLAVPSFRGLLARGRWNHIVLTGAGHTLDAYRRLPHGWRPAPPHVWTDLHMWRQFLELPLLRARTGTRITMLHFPDSHRQDVSVADRAAELETWWARSRESGFPDELAREACEAYRRAALRLEKQGQQLRGIVAEIEGTRTWRLRTRLVSVKPLRVLLARRHGAP